MNKAERRVWFPGWAEVLGREPWPEDLREAYRRLIAWFLHECKERHWAVSVASARWFREMVERERQPPAEKLAAWKEGLNWFFKAARESGAQKDSTPHPQSLSPVEAEREDGTSGPVMTGLPTVGALDLGKTEWEQRLIRQLRSLQRLWRTEQTYQGWAWRFAKFLEPRPVESATETDVREFLSRLATEQRVNAATQKQAPRSA